MGIAPSTRVKALKILTVDDEPSVASSISFALAGPTRKLMSAANGFAALARLEKDVPPPFDVVITDNNMPGMNGLELVRRLRAKKLLAAKSWSCPHFSMMK